LFNTANRNFVLRKVEDEEDMKMTESSRGTSFASRVSKYLVMTQLDDKLEMCNAIGSIMLTVLFACGTYYESPRVVWMTYVEFPILLYLWFDFFLFFYISENRLYYFFSFQSFVSYITLIPEVLILFNVVQDDIIDTFELAFWKVLRIFSLQRLEKLFVRRNMSLGLVYFSLAYSLISIIIIFASTMLMVENKFYVKPMLIHLEIKLAADPDAELNFHESMCPDQTYVFLDMLYYTVVTLTTAGYGDISPHSTLGMFLFILLFLALFSIIPKQLTELQKVYSLTSPYGSNTYKGKNDTKHILLLGDSSKDSVMTFLTECFHSDHGRSETKVVILRNSEPSDEISAILKMQQFEGKVHYYKGNPLHAFHLKRCLAQKAMCCVIMNDQFCKMPQ